MEPRSRVGETQETSLVEYLGFSSSACGYCKNGDGRASYDMVLRKITPQDYQLLLDRGWRRSGDYCYHPVNSKTCCPNFTISCKAIKYCLTRSQTTCIERLNSFLVGDKKWKHTTTLPSISVADDSNSQFRSTPQDDMINGKSYQQWSTKMNKSRNTRLISSCQRKMKLYNLDLNGAIQLLKSRYHTRYPPTKTMCRISLEDYLFPDVECEQKHHLEIDLMHVESETSKSMRDDECKLIQKYQRVIHKEKEEEWSMPRYRDFLVKSPIVVEKIVCFNANSPLLRDDNDCDLLCRYVPIRNDSATKNKRSLVRPPPLPTSYGTYHCTYRLNGKLIAVGVLDILPKCITTVYFFYDPDYGHLNLGIYSALIEISIVRRLASQIDRPLNNDGLIHYYLGFYVPECRKMHYKTKFQPSYLLCSETWKYCSTEACLKRLLDKKYARFHEDESNKLNIYHELPPVLEVIKIPITCEALPGCLELSNYNQWLEENLNSASTNNLILNFFIQYARLVGHPLTNRMTLQVNALHRAIVSRQYES